MGKKRTREAEAHDDPAVDKMDIEEDSDDSSDDDMDIVNVDFELFNYDSEIDFHGVKTLLRQLFDADSQLLDLSALSDLIVSQNTIGSTCKVDDKANDAYAFLTVLNPREQWQNGKATSNQVGRQLIDYVVGRAQASDSKDLSKVADVMQRISVDKSEYKGDVEVGIVLAERLLNMPAEVIPPMWSMLGDEIEAAVEDGEPYKFTHYLVISRAYQEVEPSVDDPQQRKQKKSRMGGGGSSSSSELCYFHPEDEEMRKHALASGTYSFAREGQSEVSADSKRAFQELGIKSHGLMMLIEASKFEGAVKAIADYIGSAS
ncbi:protein BCP1 [Diplogelasinospora grovesii]|uniref:Protein BCP1 n=1 Tax=Diplogelasinospora grovesii TaxID=303347 RepID=A0AAN6NGK8_9PEZI|nr:protein BCP1 [Diplogelasinospora grovesii]